MTPDPVFTLWFRPAARHEWEAVHTGPTSFDCILAVGIGGRHNGDWNIRPGTSRPTKGNLMWSRKRETIQ